MLDPMDVPVVTTSLELLAPPGPPRPTPDGARLERVRDPTPELGRFLYASVGGGWHWHERLSWSWTRWHDWLRRDDLQLWLASLDGQPAGYFEIERQEQGRQVELVYFGLLPAFIGRGLGGWLLDQALAQAWAWGPERVWVHTCSLDHPGALDTYRSRGFRVFEVEESVEDLPAEPPGPWPGAQAPPPPGARPPAGSG